MSYALGQTPVPVWAVPHQQPLQISPNDLPAFMLENDSESDVSRPSGNPAFLRHTGRWNSVMNYKAQQATTGREAGDPGESIDPEMLKEYDLNQKWENRMDELEETPGGLPSLQTIQQSFVKNLSMNPFFPIFLRGSAACFSIITLGLACEEFVQTKKFSHDRYAELMNSGYDTLTHSPTSSTIYTIVISCIAVVYFLFSLWDETFGQPLGLRPSHSKIKFMAVDLVLLCLESANVAVVFDAMIFKNYICPAYQNPRVCRVHKALVAFILTTLVVHFMTFLVSCFRMIDRATH